MYSFSSLLVSRVGVLWRACLSSNVYLMGGMQRKRLMRKMVETAGETALSKRRGWDGIRKEKDCLREERRVTHGDKQDGRHVGLGLTSTSKCSQNISTPTSKVTDQNNTPNQTHLCCFSSPCPPSARNTSGRLWRCFVIIYSTAIIGQQSSEWEGVFPWVYEIFR